MILTAKNTRRVFLSPHYPFFSLSLLLSHPLINHVDQFKFQPWYSKGKLRTIQVWTSIDSISCDSLILVVKWLQETIERCPLIKSDKDRKWGPKIFPKVLHWAFETSLKSHEIANRSFCSVRCGQLHYMVLEYSFVPNRKKVKISRLLYI